MRRVLAGVAGCAHSGNTHTRATAVTLTHDEAGSVVLGRPGRREAAAIGRYLKRPQCMASAAVPCTAYQVEDGERRFCAHDCLAIDQPRPRPQRRHNCGGQRKALPVVKLRCKKGVDKASSNG